MEHTGHRERLRSRFAENKFQGFSDHEVLEILLTYVIPRVDVNPLAHRLVKQFGSLWGVLECDREELMKVPGMGERSAAFITMMVPLFRRYEMDKIRDRKRLNTFQELALYCSRLFMGCEEERMYLLCFDARLQLIREVLLGAGTVQEVHVLPRLVAKEAMRHNAVSVVVTHNHPSGDPSPSQADAQLTEGLRNALETVEIRLTDHIIVGHQEAYSFHRSSRIPLNREPIVYLAAEHPQLLSMEDLEWDLCQENDGFLWE